MKALTIPFKLVFYYPGRILLWFRYIFPEKGKITESRRQYKEGGVIMAFWASCAFWATLIFFAFILVVAVTNEDENHSNLPGDKSGSEPTFRSRSIDTNETGIDPHDHRR